MQTIIQHVLGAVEISRDIIAAVILFLTGGGLMKLLDWWLKRNQQAVQLTISNEANQQKQIAGLWEEIHSLSEQALSATRIKTAYALDRSKWAAQKLNMQSHIDKLEVLVAELNKKLAQEQQGGRHLPDETE